MTPSRHARTLSALSVAAASIAVAGCSTASGSSPSDPAPGAPSSSATPSGSAAPEPGGTTPIRLTIGGTTTTGTLADNPTARDLVSRLPVTLRFGPHDDLEKTSHLDTPLDTTGAPERGDPEPGDIGYYAPQADLVLYNGDVGAFPGIIRIGTFDGPTDLVADQQGTFSVRIERDR
ncbi:cyclophilin-like fold protein [Microbacterium sp. M1A1_1b]